MIKLGVLAPGSFFSRGGQRWVVTAKRVDNTVLCCCIDDGFTAHFWLEKEVKLDFPF